MKTPIESSDDLVAQARRLASEASTTPRSVIAATLRRGLARRHDRASWASDPKLAFGADGPTATAGAMSWSELRDVAMQR